VVSSLANPAFEADLMKIGAEIVICKPVSPQKFQSVIEKILKRELQ